MPLYLDNIENHPALPMTTYDKATLLPSASPQCAQWGMAEQNGGQKTEYYTRCHLTLTKDTSA